MVAERARVSRLIVRISTPEGVPHSPYRNKRGTIDNIKLLLRRNNLMLLLCGLLKPTGNVGQLAKDNLRVYRCQCSFYDKYL